MLSTGPQLLTGSGLSGKGGKQQPYSRQSLAKRMIGGFSSCSFFATLGAQLVGAILICIHSIDTIPP